MAIRQLDSLTIGKIAAGEVIERPASAAKELVENALDAGATRIRVAIEGGGTTRIEVVDNGCGIAPEQLPLALSRHATSKLSAFEDLDSLRTLGFRGEALPSIGAVSHLVLRSRAAGEETGYQAVVSFGDSRQIAPVAAPEGTTVVVADLFENVPARRKFLRKPSTETAAIQRAIEAYALANPGVAFHLEIEGRKVFSTQGDGDPLSAAVTVLGSDVGNAAMPLAGLDESARVEGVRATGWICAPSVNRATRRSIVLFVNGRWIQNRTLTYALEEAYHTLLMVGRHPVAMISIEVDPSQVDVNVHPTKAEVKFVDERSVARAVARAVHATLATMPQPGVPRIAFADQGLVRFLPQPQSLPQTGWIAPAPVGRFEPYSSEPPQQIIRRDLPVLRVLGQAGATYIIAEGPEGIYLIDQHAAHERILYERFQTKLVAGEVERQPMLDPVVIDLAPEEVAIVEKSIDELRQLGFEIESFGDQSIVVRSVPTSVIGSDIPERIRLILGELAEGGAGNSWLDSVAISVACHTSIRAGQTLSLSEMRELVQQLEQTQHPRACGHGRPTMLQLTQDELEKQFGRK
ncbi:MAG: DNA mismatch repair endonuclease MutL [Thermomicrobiales bacterium]|nr:DNA mismatch repair endonuclease MutL [Thermomicrobiales bacterium]